MTDKDSTIMEKPDEINETYQKPDDTNKTYQKPDDTNDTIEFHDFNKDSNHFNNDSNKDSKEKKNEDYYLTFDASKARKLLKDVQWRQYRNIYINVLRCIEKHAKEEYTGVRISKYSFETARCRNFIMSRLKKQGYIVKKDDKHVIIEWSKDENVGRATIEVYSL